MAHNINLLEVVKHFIILGIALKRLERVQVLPNVHVSVCLQVRNDKIKVYKCIGEYVK